ncbi:MAG: chromosome partitioning protein ParA [Candidatus Portnoybacteria bacterium CG10_big_fil_rev_8_21_14_0_10_36_7]|uniref:Chromosome partitioning protein ParA n=1 Tax=Candidatus Portnoybacteria bacterium CG10_big_fil_rev_8_21_14_0_10_36_7 TaxID=1974812 RepID=A0A2M8KE81_9BACT|nr:MAG: chromosome partitioning protein ParA [Candidatus Portnoybacteria bacterium CG10_big_fil_rev_8_21_14_0_10_36_7]
MGKIIGLINQKGGTGKTTTATNLGAFLAAMGKYVLLVDLDPQANATSGLGHDASKIEKSLYHSIINEEPPHASIKKTSIFGYELFPSSTDLAGATVELVNLPEREYRLHNVLEKLRQNYDYILIDSPPSLGLLTINGLVAADELIVPVQTEYYALEGLGNLIRTVNLVQENLGRDLKIKGALLTMYDKRSTLSRQVAKEVQRHFPGRVFDAVIPRCVSLAEAPSHGKTILHYEPNSKGANAYRQLAKEIVDLDLES